MIIERNKFSALIKQLSNHSISILVGARQVGKSTLLSELQKNIQSPSRYLNLENPRHLNIFSEGYRSFINEVKEDIIFIDEFHYYRNMTSVFKAVYDLNPEKKIYASGSSSLEIHSHLKESLAGRKLMNSIYPLTFNEYLLQFDIKLPALGEYINLEQKNILDNGFDSFLMYGAMPGLLAIQDEIEKREYLFGIYQTYIAKDIKTFLKEESILSYNKAIEYLVINNSQQLNLNSLSKITGVSMRQMTKHIEIMEGTYVIGILRPLYNNKTKEITKTSKVYFYDHGIANVISRDFRSYKQRPDKGAILEQFVYWEIIKSLDIRFNLHYWRTADNNEVDFVLVKDREYLPIEVKASWGNPSIPSGLKAFFRHYPETRRAVILTDCQDREIKWEDKIIYCLPIYKAFSLVDMFN